MSCQLELGRFSFIFDPTKSGYVKNLPLHNRAVTGIASMSKAWSECAIYAMQFEAGVGVNSWFLAGYGWGNILGVVYLLYSYTLVIFEGKIFDL